MVCIIIIINSVPQVENHIYVVQAKNATHREEVMKADTVGLPVEGQQVTQILTKSFIEEALIISDLFDLNEYAAVELLLAGKCYWLVSGCYWLVSGCDILNVANLLNVQLLVCVKPATVVEILV